MALEPAFDNIDDLDPANPGVDDPVAQGDDHLRGIKNAIKGNVTGDATETRLLASGAMVARARAGQLALFPASDAGDVVLTLRTADDSVARGFLNAGGSSAGPQLTLANRQPGGVMIFQGRNAADNDSRQLATLDPEAGVALNHAGVTRLSTLATGAQIDGNQLIQLAGAATGEYILRNDGGGSRIRQDVNNGSYTIAQLDAAGAFEKNWAILARDSGFSLLHNGITTLRSVGAGNVRVEGGSWPLDLFGNEVRFGRDGLNYISMPDATATIRIRQQDTNRILALFDTNHAGLYQAGNEALRTQDPADSNSAAYVRDIANAQRPVGFNVMPPISIAADTTLASIHAGMLINMNSSTTRIFTLPSTNLGPQGFTCSIIVPLAGVARITPGSGATLTWLDGGTGLQGTRDVRKGAATLYQRTSTDWFIWGSGIS